MQEFRGKTAVVTGAGSGIGRALAVALAGEGMHLALADLDEQALAGTAARIGDRAPSVDAVPHVCDVSRAGDVDALADAAFARWGRVDVLCNNAGVFVGGLIWDRPVEDFEFVLGANLWGILHGIRAFVARMVVEAIRAERFLILTHDAYPQKLLDRADALVAGHLPDVPDFA